MTQLEDDLRTMFRAREEDIDAATTRNYANTVHSRWMRAGWPVLGAVAVVGVISFVAYLAWPTSARDPDPGAVLPTSATEPSRTTLPGPVVVEEVGGDPAGLLGSWSVTGTAETESVTLTLRERRLDVTRSCGEQGGVWRASQTGLFVADTISWDPACEDGATPPAWLVTASAFGFDGDSVRLLDHQGAPVAILVRDGSAGPDPSGDLPNPSDGGVVPDTLEVATPDRLLGRWVASETGAEGDEAHTQPFADFQPDGTWTGSDGCNGEGGRWIANDRGELLTTTGVSTLIGCSWMQPIGGWLETAVAAGFDQDTLVLIDATGGEVARLDRG